MDAKNVRRQLSRQLGLIVETASSRKAALIALRHTEYSLVIVDDSLVEADPAGAGAYLEALRTG